MMNFRERRELPLLATPGSPPLPSVRGIPGAICCPLECWPLYSVAFSIGEPTRAVAHPTSVFDFNHVPPKQVFVIGRAIDPSAAALIARVATKATWHDFCLLDDGQEL